MPVTFTSTMPGASADYERYLYSLPTKTDRQKDSTLLDFQLAPIDTSFVKLSRGAYITLSTTTYPKWFTGYIVNDPEPEYLGKNSVTKQPVWVYKYQATSDEYVLSLKPLGIIPPYLNMTMGAILKDLAGRLIPGMFDTSGVDDGPMVAQYVVDPDKKFFDVQQEFSESAAFRFWGHDKKLYFKAQDDSSLGSFTLDGNNTHFTPTRLSVRPVNSGSGIINDVTVLGDIEPQAYVHEYLVGTGLDSSFPLLTSVYGADTSIMIDEPFSGSSIDGSKWTVYDTPSNFLQISNGYLNSLGGSGTGTYDVRIASKSPIPLDGRLRMTHGDWDFLAGNGLICGLWTSAPSSGLTGCVYALKVNGTLVNPVVNATVDTTQAVTIDYTKRYVLRTIVEFNKTDRLRQEFNYLTEAGVVDTFGGTSESDSVVWETMISEVDPADGSITNQWTFKNAASVSTQTYATYVPLASDTLQAAFTGITISIPVAATLEYGTKLPLKNSGFDEWDDTTTPTDWTYAVNAFKEDVYSDSDACLKLSPDGTGLAYVEQEVASMLEADTSYTVIMRVRKTVGMTTGTLRVSLTGTGLTAIDTDVAVSSMSTSGFTLVSGVMTEGLTAIPSDATLKIDLIGGVTAEGVYVDNLNVLSGFKRKLIGPNEVDGLDGLRPVATIISSNQGASTRNSYLGTPQYNPGQAQLVFFKDSVTLTSDIPPENQLLRLSYRSAGPAIGRAVSRESIETEGLNWMDDGVRSVVRTDVVPRPRNSAECELAASAIVAENSVNHYDGQYEQFSPYFTAEPKAGGIITFSNVSAMANIQAEEINQVTTTFESKRPTELFRHIISFGKPDNARKILSRITGRKKVFERSTDSMVVLPVDINAIGTSWAGDVTKPVLLGWNDTVLFMDAGEALTADDLFFEVRYTDEGWGVDDGKNLITRTTSRYFQVPRTRRGKVFFIRKAKAGNHILWSEDQTKTAVYSGLSTSKSIKAGPDGRYQQITTLTFSGGGMLSGAVSGMTGSLFCGSLSIKGPASTAFTLSLGGSTKAIVTTGYWQRFTVSRTGAAPSFLSLTLPSGSATVDTTAWCVQQDTLAENGYAKTAATKYGPVSRYSSAVNVAFPSTVVSGTTIDLDSLRIVPTYSD